LLFFDVIPARVNVIRAVNAWLDQGERLGEMP